MGVNGIYGLSGSGLDVESMVKMGMLSKQSQYEKMQQNYTKQEWTKQAYLDLYDKLYKYDNNTISTFTRSNNMNARTAESSNSAIKTTATSSAEIGTHYITVDKVATNARLVGTNQLTSNGNIKLSDIKNDSDTSIMTSDVTFYIGDSTDTGVTAGTQASVSFSSDLFTSTSKLKSTLTNAIATTNGMSDFTGIKELGSDIRISGTTTNGFNNAQETPTYTNVASTDTLLSFGYQNGSKDGTVHITYGDLVEVLNNDSATFQDFVDILNKKFSANTDSNITASYNPSDGLTFTNKNASATDTVVVSLTNDGPGSVSNAIIEKLYEKAAGSKYRDAGAGIFVGNDSIGYSISLASSNTKVGTAGTNTTFDTDTMTAVTIGASSTINDLVSKINNAGTNIKASYDVVHGTFNIYNKNVGEGNAIGIVAGNSDTAILLSAMGLKKSDGNRDLTNDKTIKFEEDKIYATTGSDSSVLIDGKKYTGTNTLDVGGVLYNIANVTEKTSSVVTVDQDVDKIVDNVKSFVESYNTLLSDLYNLYSEKPNSNYAPLTDAQKAEMSEEQIKKWEEKAKSGLLYHDNNIRRIIDSMRSAIAESVTSIKGSPYDTAYSLGISTTGTQGQLKLDEDKLRKALSDDADSVYNVFAKWGAATDAAASDKANGIAQRLGGGIGSVMATSENSITRIAGTSTDNSDDSTLSTLLRNLQTRMSNFKKMMNAFEDRLYKKYDAMEAALAGLGGQLNYITSAFG